MAVRKPSVHFSPAIPARNNRSFDWLAIGEKENRERSPAENPPLANIVESLYRGTTSRQKDVIQTQNPHFWECYICGELGFRSRGLI
jgi:hypothetical protein